MNDLIAKIIAVVLTLLALAGVIALFNSASNSSKTTQALTDLTAMTGSVQALYVSHPSYANITAAVVANGKLAPSTMISGSTLVNPWGGTVTVAVNASNSSFFDVTQPSVPNVACATLATALGNLGALSINGTAATLPVDPATATASCNAGSNTLVMTFGH